MPETPTPDATAHPIQEEIRFTVAYANVYVNRTTGELELGARIYRSPAAADERRQRRRIRGNLAFVGVFPVSAVVPEAIRLGTLAANPPQQRREELVSDEDRLDDPEDE